MSSFRIDGVSESISIEDMMSILKASPLLESCNISITSVRTSPRGVTNASSAEMFTETDIDTLHEHIAMKDLSLQEADVNMAKAVETIRTFHSQQQDLFEEFRVLREKYDEQKATLMTVLWEHCREYHPGIYTSTSFFFSTMHMMYLVSISSFLGLRLIDIIFIQTLLKYLQHKMMTHLWRLKNK